MSTPESTHTETAAESYAHSKERLKQTRQEFNRLVEVPSQDARHAVAALGLATLYGLTAITEQLGTIAGQLAAANDTRRPAAAPAEAPTADPAHEDYPATVEAFAKALWAADPKGAAESPARSFEEEYAATQDRYRLMAANYLAPEDRA